MIKCPKCGRRHHDGIATVKTKCVSRDKIYLCFSESELVSAEMSCNCGHSWKLKSSTIKRESKDE